MERGASPYFSLSSRIPSFLLKWGTLLLAFFHSYTTFSQGCSDAGFCTMGAMRPNQAFSKKKNIQLNSVEIGNNIGYTKFNDVIVNYLVDLSIGIGSKSSFQVKLPYTFVYGPLASTHGLGDISASYTYSIVPKESYSIHLTMGAKIPTNSSNKEIDNLPLPMYYQTSLGTYDLVAGLSLTSSKWLLAFGYQMVVYNNNQNEFIWKPWLHTPDSAIAVKYPKSWNLKRGNDIMLRIERNFRFSRLNFFIGLLPIYRINEDVIDVAQDPALVRKSVENSNGLVVNGLLGGGYQFSVRSGIKLLIGIKLMDRETNPDGLSRVWVSNISYLYRF
jgi:hypothetical protein